MVKKTSFGMKLASGRKAARLTRYQLARRAGLDANLVNRLERGECEPNEPTRRHLAEALNLNIKRLSESS